jgi:uncharacterized protein (DUF433 family)
MAILDWSQCPAVESIPGKVGGAWLFKDTRLPVAPVIENLDDLSVEEVMEQLDVTREQIAAVLDFVARSLELPLNPAPLAECSSSLTTQRLARLVRPPVLPCWPGAGETNYRREHEFDKSSA